MFFVRLPQVGVGQNRDIAANRRTARKIRPFWPADAGTPWLAVGVVIKTALHGKNDRAAVAGRPLRRQAVQWRA
jgi:hypothetical protein